MTLIGIIGISEADIDGFHKNKFNATIKFHVKRPSEQWLANDINGYKEPVMSIESSEDLTMLFPALFQVK